MAYCLFSKDTSKSFFIKKLCKQTVAWTTEIAFSILVANGLRKIRHFADNIPKAHSITLRARLSL